MMRLAVTGGAGFVGSQIVRALVQAGNSVAVVDDYSTGHASNIEGLACDNFAIDAAAFDYSNIDAVVHAAAYPDVSANWRNPQERTRQWETNADLTRRILDRLPSDRPIPFVLISTCSVYGPGEVDEYSLLRSTSPYATSKIAAESLVQAYSEAERIRGRVCRLVNVVGRRYRHGHLADFVRMAQEGHIHALDDGMKRKSFVHVEDVADEVMWAISDTGVGRDIRDIRNITSPVVWSWRDSVAVMRAMRPEKKFELTWEERPNGWVGDPAKLTVHSTVLDGRPRRSIVEGVTEALLDLGW